MTDFSGLNVLRMTEFRRRLRAAGVSYVVVKNTLAQRALAANGITGLDEHLAGPTGLVLTARIRWPRPRCWPTSPGSSRSRRSRSGWWTARPVTPAHVKRLGEIPSREVLLAQIAGLAQRPVRSYSCCVGALEALREQRGTAS